MRKIIIFLFSMLLFSCKTEQKTSLGTPSSCNTIGSVKDFSALDGCRFLIVLESGEKLNPVKSEVANFEWKDGQKVKFGYKNLKDMASICISENAAIEITCIEEIEGPLLKECFNISNPFEVDWMNKAIDRHNPNEIVKFHYLDRWGYLLKGEPKSFFYDCQGSLLCETSGEPADYCHKRYLNKLAKGEVIWQGEGIRD